jgi:hypothetical protein
MKLPIFTLPVHLRVKIAIVEHNSISTRKAGGEQLGQYNTKHDSEESYLMPTPPDRDDAIKQNTLASALKRSVMY